MEKIDLKEYELEEQKSQEFTPGEEEQQEQQEQPETPPIDLSAVTKVVAFATSRDLPPNLQQEFQEQYEGFVTPILQIIGFDKALSAYSLQAIPPWASLLLGFGIMIGGVVILKPKQAKATPDTAKPQKVENIESI